MQLRQVVEDGYEFFGNRRLVTLFSAPNYCGEFDNAGAMMSVDEDLMCSFQVLNRSPPEQLALGAVCNVAFAFMCMRTGVQKPRYPYPRFAADTEASGEEEQIHIWWRAERACNPSAAKKIIPDLIL